MKLPPTLRSLLRQPGFSAVVILTLALGIGVNATMFSIVDTMIFRGVPIPNGERVLGLNYRPFNGNADDRIGVSYPEFQELRAAQRSFVDLAVFGTRTMALIAPGRDPERIESAIFTAAGTQMLEAPLALGRWFTAAEEQPGAPLTVVLTEATWRRACAADPKIIGTTVRLDGEWATVIGVAATGYRFPELSDAFVPPRPAFGIEKRDARGFTLFGRVKPGLSMAQARAELESLAARQVLDHPEGGKDLVPRVMPLSHVNIGSTDQTILSVMLAAVFLVLLIACANAANLLLVRALGRERELAVRSALGAGRRELVGLIFRESSILAAAGSIFGLLLGAVGIRIFSECIQNLTVPYWMVFALDARAVAYTLAIAAFACLAAGVMPALRLTRPDLNAVLSDSSRGSSGHRLGRFTSALVVGQIALSALLLVLSALTVRTLVKIHTLPLGFTPEGLYSGRVALPKATYPDLPRQREFHATLLDRLRTRPEVAAAALCDSEATWDGQARVAIDGRTPASNEQRGPVMCLLVVSPGYFETLGIGLLAGRDFTVADTAETLRVGVVSSEFAEKHWPGENPLGKRFRQAEPGQPADAWVTVVGVARNRMQGRFNRMAAPQVYVPAVQFDDIERMSVFVRSRSGDAAAMAPVLSSTVRSLNAELPVYFGQTVEQSLLKVHYNRKLMAGMFTVFGGVAAVLAAIGLFGVTSYGVAQRTQEIGIRMALGADRAGVLRMILREGLILGGIGVALGLPLALGAGQLLSSALYRVSAFDPWVLGGVPLVLLAVAAFASYLPALRATRIQPARALRAD